MKSVQAKKCIFFVIILFLAANGMIYAAFADHDDHDDHRRGKTEKRYSEHHGKHGLSKVNNPLYVERCGACHAPYQPGLLPSGSWQKILNGLSDHFGEEITFDGPTKNRISEYLTGNAADHSKRRLCAKIMKSLKKQTPLRITEVPYIQRKHHEIATSVFERESIGSRSNCSACHRTADEGIYDDDDVSIPR